MKAYRVSLTFAILSSVACLLLLTWILLSLISFKTAENDLLAQKSEEGRRLLTAIVSSLPASLADVASDERAQRLIGTLAAEQAFAGIAIVAVDGTPFYAFPSAGVADERLRETARSGRESFFFAGDGRTLYRYAPVTNGNAITGAARLTLSLAAEQARLTKSRNLFLAYFILDFLLLLSFGYFLLNRIIVAPVQKLLHATERVTAGDYSLSVHTPGCRELAEVADSFNVMVNALRTKHRELGAHVQSLEQANRDLQAAREETIRSEKMASVGILAAGMAHEVGSPLSAIIGFAGILRDELRDDREKADYLRRIENEAGRIDRIVRSLLDYARPSHTEFEPVLIGTVISATIELLQAQGALKGISVEQAVEAGLPPVLVDRHELQQVLINLLLNARDAMPSGGRISVKAYGEERGALSAPRAPAGSASIMGRRRDDFNGAFHTPLPGNGGLHRFVVITVSDTGTGITPDCLGRIFDPFFTTKEPGQGTGLGLAICARIIDSFDGRIIAQSERGKGAAFTILLPAPGLEAAR